jgi:site-specific DNA-methyltransferase (adenine-specific)
MPKRKPPFEADSRATPPELYEVLNKEFSFTLDPCPLDESATAGAALWGKDGLSLDWRGHSVFCNPPYSVIEPWLRKATEPPRAVYLLPVKSDMGWWHEYVMRAREVRFIRGRLRFGGMSGGAPFASAVVIFNGRWETDTRWRSMERPRRG